jgi:hypothetical protein
MAAVTMKAFTSLAANAFGGETAGESSAIDWLSDTIKLTLHSALPNQDTAEFYDAVSASEVTGTNWAAGGVTLGSKAILRDNTTNTIGLDAGDVSVATVTVTGVTHIVVRKDTGTAATSPLICYGILDASSGSSGGTLAITFAATGLVTFAAAA